MKKRFSIYHFLIAVLIFSIFTPLTSVFANHSNGDGDGNGNGNGEVTGSLTIVKYSQDPKKGQIDEGEPGDGNEINSNDLVGSPLEGVKYTIKQTHSYDPSTDDWTEISNGKTYTKTTDADGRIVIDSIKLGRYTMQETDAPKEVVRDEREYIIDVPMTSKDGSGINYDVHIYPKNELIRGAVELTKTDGDSNKFLKGVKFKLYDSDDNYIGKHKTDEDGKIKVDGLPYGSYYFKEVKTLPGYLLGNQKVEFSIKNPGSFNCSKVIPTAQGAGGVSCGDPTGEIIKVNVENYVEPEVEKSVNEDAVNRGETVTYSIKVDLPGDIHKYKEFIITDELDERLSYVDNSWDVDGVNKNDLEFDKNGQILTWAIDEPIAFDGVKEIIITFDAIIAEDAEANVVIDNKATIDFENKHGNKGHKESNNIPVTPTVGFLKIVKKDENGENRLSGAKFELRDLDGNKIKEGTTDSNGVIDFGELHYGNYQLVETKAPEGYNKLQKPISVTINSAETKTVEVNNYKSGWELPKTGGIGTTLFTAIGTLLMGLAFYLYTRRRKETA